MVFEYLVHSIFFFLIFFEVDKITYIFYIFCRVAETEAEIEARIDKWDKYLEDVEDKKEEEQKAAVKKENEEREQARSSVKK